MKHQIEQRINVVADYTGAMDLAAVLSKMMPPKTVLGMDPAWMVARACMSPEEYAQLGRDGEPWKFMAGRLDMAARAIEVVRGVVAKRLEEMGLQARWERLGRAARVSGVGTATEPNEPYWARG